MSSERGSVKARGELGEWQNRPVRQKARKGRHEGAWRSRIPIPVLGLGRLILGRLKAFQGLLSPCDPDLVSRESSVANCYPFSTRTSERQ